MIARFFVDRLGRQHSTKEPEPACKVLSIWDALRLIRRYLGLLLTGTGFEGASWIFVCTSAETSHRREHLLAGSLDLVSLLTNMGNSNYGFKQELVGIVGGLAKSGDHPLLLLDTWCLEGNEGADP